MRCRYKHVSLQFRLPWRSIDENEVVIVNDSPEGLAQAPTRCVQTRPALVDQELPRCTLDCSSTYKNV